jgi:hypothetical protein
LAARARGRDFAADTLALSKTYVTRISAMNTLRAPQSEARRRHHRWLIIALVVIAGLTIYGIGLGWVAQRLQHDLANTIQPLPVQEDRQHSAD